MKGKDDMKKRIVSLCTIFIVFVLSGCVKMSSDSIHKNLQAHKWNVVSTNGEAYTADFAEDTVAFDLTISSLGFHYKVDEDQNILTLTDEKRDKEVNFDITKKENEYMLKSKIEEVHKQYGELTFSPAN